MSSTDSPKNPESCTTMIEVRAGVDAVDAKLVELLAQRFALASKRLGLNRREGFNLDCTRFCPPGGQLALL